MRSALETLKLDRLIVIYPGHQTYALADQVVVTPLAAFVTSPHSV